MEVWKSVTCNSNYEISNLGCVRRVTQGRGTYIGRVLRAGISNGYWLVVLAPEDKSYYVHRLVAAAFIGAIDKGMDINHINSDRLDNRVENLEICTRLHNVRHAMAMGRTKVIGSLNHTAKLNDGLVREIRAMKVSGLKGSEIARRIGVEGTTVRNVLRGLSWTHVV